MVQDVMGKSYQAKAAHRIIFADDKKIELLHRININELQILLKSIPGLLASSIVILEPEKNTQHSFKIVLGEGGFSRVRLARYQDETGHVIYVAQRKILSQEKLNARHGLRNLSNRANVIAATQRELNIAHYVSDKTLKQRFFYIEEKNRKNLDQIYQFYEIASFKDLNKLPSFFALARLANGSKEKKAVLESIAFKMIQAVITIHALNVSHKDIKPDNFLLTIDGEIKLVDYGSAALLKADNTWEVAAGVSDIHYAPPTFLFNAQRDLFTQYQIMDQWALGLSILKIFGMNITKENYNLAMLSKTSRPIKSDAWTTNRYLEIRKRYEQLIEKVQSQNTFKDMSLNLQQFILKALDLNLDRNHQIQNMVQFTPNSEANDTMMKKALLDASREVDRQNNNFLATLADSMVILPEYKQSTTTNNNLNHSIGNDFVNLGGGYYEQDGKQVVINHQLKKTSSKEIERTTIQRHASCDSRKRTHINKTSLRAVSSGGFFADLSQSNEKAIGDSTKSNQVPTARGSSTGSRDSLFTRGHRIA